MISRITSIKRHTAAPEIPISIKQSFIIGDVISYCGNENVWKTCQCTKIDSGQNCSIQIYEKRNLEKIYKSKRKEYVSEILRREIECLHEFRHNYVLQLFTSAHENNDYLMFVCEPILCSLANLIDERETLPETSINDIKTRKLMTLEILLGFYQMVEALRHLHITHGIIHGNLCPSNILIGTHNQWKLTGLGFCIKLSEKGKSHNYSWNSKQVKYGQPDINYIAPEIQLKNIPMFQSDIFSLGLIICSIYNNGCSLIECSRNVSLYLKKIDELRSNFLKIYSKLPNSIGDTVQQMLSRIPTERPDIEELREMDCFKDSLILSLDSLFSLDGKSMNERKDFFNLFSKLVVDYSEDLRYQRILPILMDWFRFSTNLTTFVLPSILTMIYKATKADFDKYLYFNLQYILNTDITIQTAGVLLDLLEFYIDRLEQQDILSKILPLFIRVLEDPGNADIQTTNNNDPLWNCLLILQNILTSTQLKEQILSKLKIIFNKDNQTVKVQILCLECLDQLLEDLDNKTIVDDVIPFLTTINHSNTSIYLAILGVYKHMVSTRNSGISFKLIAKKILPPLIPQAVNPGLKAEEFILVMHVLRKLLDKIERDRCSQLNIESVRSNSGSLSSIGSNINCNRVLPLISMQQPTMEIDYGSQNSFNSRMTGSRRGSNVTDYRRGSTDNTPGSRRNSALINRLKLNNSESLLFPTRNRRGSAFDNRNWSKTNSNPAFISQLSGENSRENIQLSSNSMQCRRLSGNTTSYLNKGLAVPNNQFPRRHSYESSHNASINSLITASVCEGPFISPSNSRAQSRRTSAQSLGPQIIPGNNARRMSSTGSRRLSFNAFSDTLINLFQ